MYLSIFHCLCFVEAISVHIAEEQVMEERYPDLEWDEDFIISTDSEQHWKEAEEEENEYRGKVCDLRWEVYTKEKEGLTKREFLVAVPHPKRRQVLWNCVEGNVVGEKEEYK